MGTVARQALEQRNEYACGLSRVADPQHRIFALLDEVLACRPDVLLDLTTQPASFEISLAAVSRGVPTVVGSSGWQAEQRDAFGRAAERGGVGALVVPNFSIGAVLMMRFAQQAARLLPSAGIVEMHAEGKKDKPSATALETAARIESAGGRRPEIHSVRLPGLVAHQVVLFGGTGELLTIRHDSLSRESFVAGMIAAVHGVRKLRGLHVGLESVLEVA
jgi:4-hydroxy-tetrahydrodipicolinate reductase